MFSRNYKVGLLGATIGGHFGGHAVLKYTKIYQNRPPTASSKDGKRLILLASPRGFEPLLPP